MIVFGIIGCYVVALACPDNYVAQMLTFVAWVVAGILSHHFNKIRNLKPFRRTRSTPDPS